MGLEPTASAVTVRRSNQAELQPLFASGKPGSNRRPSRWQRDALPTELFPRLLITAHTPTGIRTPVAALRTQNPRPLDDGGLSIFHALTGNRTPVSTLKEWRPNR